MKRTKRRSFPSSILAVTAASMALTACDYIDSHLHSPSDDNPIQASSSSNKPRSSSTVQPSSPFETWYGYNGDPQIQTGFGNETETNGYWFYSYDDADGGASQIIWPVPKGNEYSDDAMDPIIEYCGGLCGTFALDKGTLTYNPFVSVGFNIVGEESGTNSMIAAADASSMGGVCVTYASEIPLSLEMGLTAEAEADIGYAVPYANLPKSITGTTKYLSWSDFKQPTWYKGSEKLNGEQAAKQLASLRFRFQAASGTIGRFNITAVGPYDGCQASSLPVYLPYKPEPNPVDTTIIIDPPQPQPVPGEFQTWFGSNGEARIITGHDVGTETSGYWFSLSDDADGGYSTIIWPVSPGSEYSDNDMTPIIEACGGLCGTTSLDKGQLTYNPFAGVGFLVAGEKSDFDRFPAATDASDMGGICISYTSDLAPSLELGLGDDVEASIGYAAPMAALPKSRMGTTKFIKWSDFKQPSWYKGSVKINGEQAAKQLVSIKFKMQAAPGNYNFNIRAIGPYNGGKCSL